MTSENRPGDVFDQIHPTVTMPLTDAQRVRLSVAATDLDLLLREGYMEANFAAKLLELAKVIVPLLAPLVGAL